MFQSVQVRSRQSKVNGPSDPYEQFLAEQKKRSLEWKSTREAKRAKVQSITPVVASPAIKHQNDVSSEDRNCRHEDSVTLLRQQLAAQTEECRELKKKMDSIEAINAQILRNQIEMKDNFIEVMFPIVIKRQNNCSMTSANKVKILNENEDIVKILMFEVNIFARQKSKAQSRVWIV